MLRCSRARPVAEELRRNQIAIEDIAAFQAEPLFEFFGAKRLPIQNQLRKTRSILFYLGNGAIGKPLRVRTIGNVLNEHAGDMLAFRCKRIVVDTGEAHFDRGLL